MSILPDDKALKGFRQVSIEETIKYIMKSPSKSCKLDPVPIDLLKEAIHEIAPTLMNLINTSLNLVLSLQNSKELSFSHYSKKPLWILWTKITSDQYPI